MKPNKILSALLCGSLMFGIAACTDEVEYDPTEQVSGEGFYLSNTGTAEVSIEEDATHVYIPVYRTNTSGEATAQLESSVTDADGNPLTDIFTVPSSVTFPDGSKEVALAVAVDFSKIEALEEYTISLRIVTDQTTPYARQDCVYTLYYAPWSEWYYYDTQNLGYYQQNAVWSYGYQCPVIIRYSLVDQLCVQIGTISPFSDLEYYFYFTVIARPEYQYNPDGEPNADEEYINELPEDELLDVTKLKMTYYVTSNLVNTTLTDADGYEVWFGDAYTISTEVWDETPEAAEAWLQSRGYDRSYFYPQQGLFSIFVVPYAPESNGGIYPSMVGVETLQLPGNFKTYSIALAYSGNFVDSRGNETAIVSVTLSEDVSAYAYSVVNGTLTDEEVEAEAERIENDPDAELITEDGNLSLTFEEDGTYTIVAVGYDETGEAVCNASLKINYESVQKNNPWQTLGICEYTDGFMTGFEGIGGETWEVEIQESKETAGLYRVVNPYASWPTNANGQYSVEGNFYITIDASDPDGVWIPESEMGINVNPSYGDLVAWSMAGYQMTEQGATLAACKRAGLCGTLDNGVITFPAETLLVCFPNTGAIYYANQEDVVMIDMSFIEARAPQKAAANKSKKISGPLNINGALKSAPFSYKKVTKGKVISHDEQQKYALKHRTHRSQH